MAFLITPIDNTPAEDNGFPRYIQFQQDGVNLGGPDATVVNFTNGLIAMRAPSGVDDNTVVVMLG
jgi:hypothetical protein